MQILDLVAALANILPTPPSGTPAELAADGITFFETWIARIGGLVAFIGAIKFALSIKDDNAREQLLGVLVMVSGFMIQSAVNDLSIFNIPASYSDAAANLEFQSILSFIGKWTLRVGGVGMLIGGIMIGFSIKDHNVGAKVTALKTFATGAIVATVSTMLHTFV